MARRPRPSGVSDWSSVLAAELTSDEARSLVFVFLATTLGAVLSRWHLRLVLPTVVVEIVLGILIGPEVLGLAEVDAYITFLSDFGLALLFFFAGLEVIEHHVPTYALAPRDDRLGHLARDRPGVGIALDAAGVEASWWLLGRRARDDGARHARPDPLGRGACSRPRSAGPCSVPGWPASSGRSSSSRSS